MCVSAWMHVGVCGFVCVWWCGMWHVYMCVHLDGVCMDVFVCVRCMIFHNLWYLSCSLSKTMIDPLFLCCQDVYDSHDSVVGGWVLYPLQLVIVSLLSPHTLYPLQLVIVSLLSPHTLGCGLYTPTFWQLNNLLLQSVFYVLHNQYFYVLHNQYFYVPKYYQHWVSLNIFIDFFNCTIK